MNVYHSNSLKSIQLAIGSLSIHFLYDAFFELRLLANIVEVFARVYLAKNFLVWYNDGDRVGLI